MAAVQLGLWDTPEERAKKAKAVLERVGERVFLIVAIPADQRADSNSLAEGWEQGLIVELRRALKAVGVAFSEGQAERFVSTVEHAGQLFNQRAMLREGALCYWKDVGRAILEELGVVNVEIGKGV